MTKLFCRWLLSTLVLASAYVGSQEVSSLDGVLSWSGNGRIFQIGVDQQEFLGVIEGVFYIETSEGRLDDAFMECSVKQRINHQSNINTATGNCVIVLSPQNNAFGEYKCQGDGEACRGKFTLTGGTGDFEGISGGSDILIRSPVQDLAVAMTDQENLVIANGVALFTDLEYQLKGRSKR
jgi:hypothetical protein